MSPTVRSVLQGLLYNLLVMVGFAIVYGIALVHLVAQFQWARFLGEFWFVAFIALCLPAYLFSRSKKTMALGALLSFVPYLLVVVPLTFIRGD
jgi:hypothetical protein